MGDITNDFAWSPSRGRTFDKCKRAYWFTYYGGWNGWGRDAHPGRRIVYRFKKMNALIPWSGNLAHDVFEWAAMRISKSLSVEKEAMIQRARAAMEKGWREAIGDGWVSDPKRSLVLEDIYYEGLTDRVKEKSRSAWGRVESSIDKWWDMGWPEVLQTLQADDWVELEGRSKVKFRGAVEIFVQPDLAYWRGGHLWVVDWKTGRPKAADEKQILMYVIWAIKMKKASLDQIRTVLVYLGADATEKTGRPTMESLKEYADELWADLQRVVELLEDQDIEKNVAKAENFPMTDDRSECRYCVFRQLCHGEYGPGAQKAGDPRLIEPPEAWPL